MKKVLGPALSLSFFILTACGPDSNVYDPAHDTVSVSASITIEAKAQSIQVFDAEPIVRSHTIEGCEINIENGVLPFAFASNDELTLNSQTLEYIRPLASPPANPEGDSRLYAVWKIPTHRVGQVSYNIEIEIQAAKIIYRNTCIQ